MEATIISPKLHAGPMTAIDSWDYFVVTAGFDNLVNVCRHVGEPLVVVATKKMPSTPTSIKIVEMDNRQCVMVVRKGWTSVEYYSLESLTLIKSVAFHNSDHGPQSFTHLEIELDQTRTRYFIATNDTPNLRIISGVVGSSSFTSSIVEGVQQNEHSEPQLAWRKDSPYVWVAGVDEFVRQVRINDGTVVRKLQGNFGFMKKVIVSGTNREIVMAIGDRGMGRWEID